VGVVEAGEAGLVDAVDGDRFEEHGVGAHPKAGVGAVGVGGEGAVDDEGFERLAVARHAHHFVEAALVVLVAAQAGFRKGRKIVHGMWRGERGGVRRVGVESRMEAVRGLCEQECLHFGTGGDGGLGARLEGGESGCAVGDAECLGQCEGFD
jgi:hypothetical protein